MRFRANRGGLWADLGCATVIALVLLATAVMVALDTIDTLNL